MPWPKPKAKPRKQKKESAQPTRHSSRLQGGPSPDQGSDPKTQFAIFIIDGECPKCGKVYSTGHRKHFEACTGTGVHRQPPVKAELTPEEKEEEEMAAAAQVRQFFYRAERHDVP